MVIGTRISGVKRKPARMEGFSGRGSRFDFSVILRKLGKALHLWWMAGWLDGVYSGIEVYSHSTIQVNTQSTLYKNFMIFAENNLSRAFFYLA